MAFASADVSTMAAATRAGAAMMKCLWFMAPPVEFDFDYSPAADRFGTSGIRAGIAEEYPQVRHVDGLQEQQAISPPDTADGRMMVVWVGR